MTVNTLKVKYQKLLHTFEGYLGNVYYNAHEADTLKAEIFLKKFASLEGTATGALPLFFIIDYTRQDYLLFSDNIGQVASYRSQEFLEGGLDMLRFVFHKDDFPIYNQKIFVRNCSFLQSVPREKHEDYLFSYTFRVQNRKGGNQFILQRGSYITSPSTGLPLYSLGTCQDISHLKQDTRMLHTIENKSHKHALEQQLVEKNFFYPNAEDTLFTRKEKEVLLLLADGRSTKQVADKLHVAATTVISHRKSMMQKSNSKNAVELVAYAIRTGII